MLRTCILLILLFAEFNLLKAQQETHNWYFGYTAGVSFSNGLPFATNNSAMNTYEGCASVSDNNGRLLFYTNGQTVWNRNHVEMANGYGLKGDDSSTQSSLVIPKPGSSTLYYIFTTNALENGVMNQLYYSEVDMSLNQGLGGITTKNVLLHQPVTEKLTAVFHENNKDVWVITHEWASDAFYAYLVTSAGINTPVISRSGRKHAGGTVPPHNNANALGAIKVSPDGSKLAAAINYDGIVEVLSFDNATGKISDPVSISVNNPYGLEFSPDGTKLYVSTLLASIYQFSLSGCGSSLLAPDGVVVGETNDNFLGSLQLSTNGKIYVARNRARFLGVIEKPNEAGSACTFVAEGVSLNGKISGLGLPNFIQNYFDQPPFTYSSNCIGEPTVFSVSNRAGIDSVRWEFSHKSTGVLALSQSFTTQYTFDSEGIYSVQLTIYYTGKPAQTFCRKIQINPNFEFSLGKDTVICNRSPYYLSVLDKGDSFVWQNGSASPSQKITQSGTYWVEVKKAGCIKRDSITVSFEDCPITIPNVITPNQDDANDTFFIPDLQENWSLVIMNRWGKTVYQTNNYRNDWAAHGLDTGIYYYLLHDPASNRSFKGWVHVLR